MNIVSSSIVKLCKGYITLYKEDNKYFFFNGAREKVGIEELIREFLNEEVQDDEIENSIWLFFGYLSDDCDIEDIEEVDRETIEEFLSWWYLQDPLIMSAERAAYLMVSLVIFFDWLYVRYGNELIGDVKDVCHELVRDLPRVLMVDWSEIAPDATDPSDIDSTGQKE